MRWTGRLSDALDGGSGGARARGRAAATLEPTWPSRSLAPSDARGFADRVNRWLNFVLALLALIALLPLLLVIALSSG